MDDVAAEFQQFLDMVSGVKGIYATASYRTPVNHGSYNYMPQVPFHPGLPDQNGDSHLAALWVGIDSQGIELFAHERQAHVIYPGAAAARDTLSTLMEAARGVGYELVMV
ncbi:hypothetical protein HYY74_04285 [Candidatus Woesearchaeota archaeon]|nr:hypothetical protein [Candidatus Woesearchaeota archaeon]